MYDFHKVPHLQQGVLIAESEYEIWEFSNPHFQKFRPDLLVLVTRKRNRDRDTVDPENISLSTIVQDLSTIKKYQSTIGTEIRDLHRDNEILWQETLNAREKYQRHQEAIEKILQFLTSIFANDHLAISMNNVDSLPKGLIEEAASLAGMTCNKLDETTSSKSSNNAPVAATTSSLSNILSSVLKLCNPSSSSSGQQPQPQPEPLQHHHSHHSSHHNHHHQASVTEPMLRYGSNHNTKNDLLLQQQQQQQLNNKDDGMKPNIVDFSKTLNTATKSAQSITQDIDMLQINIESLANNLGIDPSQFDDDLGSDRYFIDNGNSGNNNYSTAGTPTTATANISNNNNPMSPTSAATTTSTYAAIADTDNSDDLLTGKRNYHQCQQQQQYGFNLQNPSPGHYSSTNNTNSSFQQQNQKPDGGQYRQLLSYSDSFGPNYPTSSDISNDDYSNTSNNNTASQQPQQQSRYQAQTGSPYYPTNGTADQSLLNTTGTTAAEYNAMVNDYTGMMRPSPYFNNGPNAVTGNTTTTTIKKGIRDNYNDPS